jgi:hypothetical protein
MDITPEIEAIARCIHDLGPYENETDVLHEALDLPRKWNQLRKDIAEGCLI